MIIITYSTMVYNRLIPPHGGVRLLGLPHPAQPATCTLYAENILFLEKEKRSEVHPFLYVLFFEIYNNILYILFFNNIITSHRYICKQKQTYY